MMWLFLSCVLLNLFMTSAFQYTPEIEVQSGRIRGYVETLTTKAKIRKYLGIPFAQAERFEMPVAPSKWKDVKDMTSFGKVCFQYEFGGVFDSTFDDMSEDCLNLNVYVPDKQTSSKRVKLPVMVWIHGGGYISNSNRISDGSYLATIGEVIVVTINYRLGNFGFLASKDYGFNGNYGLYDQLEALKWVNKNIEKFGGDPKQVTIFGNSAGGMSVSLLSLSPLAKGLFKYAIMQSGVSNSAIAYEMYQGKTKADNFFKENLKCKGTVTQVKNCAKSFPAKSLAQDFTYIQPVVDGTFLPDKPENLVKSKYINPTSVLLGVAGDDGSCMTDALPDLSEGIPVFKNMVNDKKKFKELVKQSIFVSRFAPGNPLYVEAVTCKYTTKMTDFTKVTKNRRIFLDFLTDSVFIAPGVVHAQDLVQRGVRTFFYKVDYGLPMKKYFKVPSPVKAYHETEKFMVFGFALKDNEPEYTVGSWLSREMMKMWSNFAKTGDPNSPSALKQNIQWPQYDLTSKKYLVIKPVLEVKSDLRPGAVKFWEKDMRSLSSTISQICKTAGIARKPKMMMPPSDMNKEPPKERF